jgi:VWFA-related protein
MRKRSPLRARPRARAIGLLGLLFAGAATLAGQTEIPPQRHESVVVNIEVPVRVLRKDVFVEGLTLADFEVYEDGVPQKVEAVYLIKDKEIVSEEKVPGAVLPRPRGVRHYVLYLYLKEYLPKIGETLDFFFTSVLGPKDTLFVVTPAKTYRFHSEFLSRTPRAQIADKLKTILKTDVQLGNSPYRRLMRDFYDLEEMDYPPDMADVKETQLFDIAKQMRDLTEITERQVMQAADTLKAMEGEKHLFLIFQRDVLPDHEFSDDRQAELFKPVTFDVEKIKRYYSDASITVHCLYITKTPTYALHPMNQTHSIRASHLEDLSSDVFASFRQMADATGGLSESTSNPFSALRQAAEASSHYYLLFYRPVNYRADGRFQMIDVRVKGKGLKVTHRLGYVAN